MKQILIINTSTLHLDALSSSWMGHKKLGNASMREIAEASVVIAKDQTHFRCLKNRWEDTPPDEKIPNRLLCSYIAYYQDNFTKEELIESLIPNL